MKSKIISIIAGCLLAGGGAAGYFYWKSKKEHENAKTYSSLSVIRGNLLITVQATGTVQPENRLVIKAPINGRIDTVLVEEGQKVEKNKMLAQMSSTDRAALLDAARAKGAKEVKHWEEIYKPTPIIAPLSGVIISRNVEPGQVISSVDPVFSMSDHLIVSSQVDETDIAKVKIGQEVSVVLDAYSQEKIPGKVSKIAFDARTVNNVTIYDVQIIPNKIPEFMRSGMTASVRFNVEEHSNAILIPESVVKRNSGRVSVLIPHSEAEKPPVEQDIQVGLSDGKQIEVISGLNEGQTILQENIKMPEGKGGGGNPFSPMGQGKNPTRGR